MGGLKNEIGNIYGYLTVVERAKTRRTGVLNGYVNVNVGIIQ